ALSAGREPVHPGLRRQVRPAVRGRLGRGRGDVSRVRADGRGADERADAMSGRERARSAKAALAAALACAAALAAAPALAQAPIETVHVQGNVHMLIGAGGNIAVQVGDDGVLVVDTGSAERGDDVLAAIRRLSDGPIRWIIN